MRARLISIDPDVTRRYIQTTFKFVFYIAFIAACVAICVGAFALSVIAIHQLKGLKVNSTLVLEYINALKYPLLILFLGMFFHKPIKTFLNETDSIDTKYGKINRKRPGSQEGEPSAVRSLSDSADEPLGDTEETVDSEAALELQLTSDEAIAEYHRIYGLIWGSQLEALKKLQSFRDGLAPEDLEEFLELHQSKYGKDGSQSVNDLLKYPISESLIKYDPGTKTYFLTYAGLYFLQYLQARGLYDKELLF